MSFQSFSSIFFQHGSGQRVVLTGLLVFTLSFQLVADPPEKQKITRVVIDPGHGGVDPGALGKFSREKDIVLAISLKLGQYIKENIPGVEVFYTRDADVFVPLHERAGIANRHQADLFISIHANANKNSAPVGAETYAMGLTKADGNLEVAKRENSVILIEEDYTTRYEGFDPNSAESYIMFSLLQNTHLTQSLTFASFVQEQFRERARRVDRGVKQAGFLVLWQTTMPSVLVEVGFISNPDEEKYLNSLEGQDYLASAIYRAFRDYKQYMEQRSVFRVMQDIPAKQAETKPRASDTPEVNQSPGSPVVSRGPGVEFRVQVTSSSRPISTNSETFKGFGEVIEIQSGDRYRYAVGKELTYEKIVEYSKSVRQVFPDAFVIALKDGEVIPVHKAIELSSR